MDDQNKKDEQIKPETQDAAKESVAPTEESADQTIPVPSAETPAETTEPAAPETPATTGTPDVTAEPTPQPVTPDMGYTETKSSKLVYLFVAILLIILLSLVGLFFYKQMMTAPSETQLSPTPAQVSPTEVVSPTVTPANEEEADLQQIDIPDIDQDLQQIESDLNQL